ncbi:MAG: orotidine-5'-phosphate decarboxylase [Candidatus Sumerlaeaceae bacterium]|nr:orotidine-5'-phosphate decarboxylase [Candidatus Sumerlaeaceae bacterium]
MTQTFIGKFDAVVAGRQSNLCVGLDPDFEKVRAAMRPLILKKLGSEPLYFGFVSNDPAQSAEPRNVSVEQLADEPDLAKEAACELIMGATLAFAAAFKPNAAFFELAVASGTGVPQILQQFADPVLSIFDGKRGDIGNTSEQYARAIFHDHGYDAVTVNPLMGYDAVEPFLRDPAHGVFLLCLTSNPGAADFLLKNEMYKRIAEKAVEWNKAGNVGLVVGATRPEYAAAVREIAPEVPLLIPGVGAQGGSLKETLDAIGGRGNRRFLINASRSIMFPTVPEGQDHLFAVANAARTLRDEINAALA